MKRKSDCPLNCSLEIFGDKWTLLIIRDILVRKKKHYKEFLNSKEGISTNILADRLNLLVKHGILEKERDSENRLQYIYEITPKGKDLFPVILAIAKWGKDHIEGVNWKDVEP